MTSKEIRMFQIIGHKTDDTIESVISDFEEGKGHSELYPNSKIKWRFNWHSGLYISEYSEFANQEDILDIKEHLIFKYGIVYKKTGKDGGDYDKEATYQELLKRGLYGN